MHSTFTRSKFIIHQSAFAGSVKALVINFLKSNKIYRFRADKKLVVVTPKLVNPHEFLAYGTRGLQTFILTLLFVVESGFDLSTLQPTFLCPHNYLLPSDGGALKFAVVCHECEITCC